MAERLTPIVNALSQPFWDAAAAGRLCLPFCTATDRTFWPPSPSSPFATGGDVSWRETPPEGIVRSLVVYRRAFQQALADRLPYGVALVEVAPGVRLLAHVPGPGGAAAGDRVRLTFRPLRDGELPVLMLESRL
ncbi:MAG TPA: OB-fold domain-containing protein [Allosphingosinicella sp.]|jgi:hypothetical protein|nr:OB-fold domain-containing protein [Allosphingosinicella sp.]